MRAMTHGRWMAAAWLAASAACTQATPEQQIVADVAAALGGAERLQAVRTLVLEGEGTMYNLGQDMTPGASGQTFALTPLRRVLDLERERLMTEHTRVPNFAYFQGQQPARQLQGLDGEIAYNMLANGNFVRVSNQVAHERRMEYYHHPVTLVRAALDPGAVVENVRSEGDSRRVDVITAGGLQFQLTVDAAGLPTRIANRAAHPNLGDVVISTGFSGYEPVDGVQLPSRLAVRVDDFTTVEMRFDTLTLDADAGELAAPEAARSGPLPGQAPPNVVAEPVAPGLWLMAGQSHHSALVEFADHLALIDAPQSEARTLAVIAAARELRPEKPLTRLVATHHHFDHTAGVRAAIAEGLTVVTHEGNRAFFEEMASRPHTIVPDALARTPKPLSIETFEDELAIEDKAMSMTLYHLSDNPHSDTMLMAYFPRQRVIVQVDAYSPNAQVHPYAANVLEHIRTRNLRVDRVVPLHGSVVTMAELERAAP
jgi:glyoxylase-like metal-dependent hydrolase (beta-lactamase superfamily II)